MRRPFKMSAAAERDLAYRISRLPLPARLPSNVELTLAYGREPSAQQVERREAQTIPARAS